MTNSDVTDDQIREQITEIVSNKELRRCYQCGYSNNDYSFCEKLRIPISKFQYSGLCKYYIANEEMLLKQCREELKRRELSERKMDVLLTTCLNCLDTAMVLLEDFGRRLDVNFQAAEIRGTCDRRTRRSDLKLVSELKQAIKKMRKFFEDGQKQFQHYVQPIFNRTFYDSKLKQYDVKGYDMHLQDVMELAHLVLRFYDVTAYSDANAEAVFDLMKSMKSESIFSEGDYNHYQLKKNI